MTILAVTTEELEQLVNHIASFTTNIREHIASLDARITDMHVTWSGHAADAHRAGYEKQKQGLEEMLDGLKTMQEALISAHTNYAEAVTENIRRMEAL